MTPVRAAHRNLCSLCFSLTEATSASAIDLTSGWLGNLFTFAGKLQARNWPRKAMDLGIGGSHSLRLRISDRYLPCKEKSPRNMFVGVFYQHRSRVGQESISWLSNRVCPDRFRAYSGLLKRRNRGRLINRFDADSVMPPVRCPN